MKKILNKKLVNLSLSWLVITALFVQFIIFSGFTFAKEDKDDVSLIKTIESKDDRAIEETTREVKTKEIIEEVKTEETTAKKVKNEGIKSEFKEKLKENFLNTNTEDKLIKDGSRELKYSSKSIEKSSEVNTASLFDVLKEKVATATDGETIELESGEYIFNDTLTIDGKNITLKNKDGGKIKFVSDLLNTTSTGLLGKTMINIVNGGSLVIDTDSNENFVFDGSKAKNDNNISGRGVFITVNKGSELIVRHGIFENSFNSGMQSAPILVNGGKFTLEDGIIRNNEISFSNTSTNDIYVRPNYPDPDTKNTNARAAGVAVRDNGEFIMNGGEISGNADVLLKNPNLYDSTQGPGAIAIQGGKFTMKDGTISDNHGGYGQIYISSNNPNSPSIAVIENGTFTKNESNYGGVIHVGSNSDVTIKNGDFTDNKSEHGGVIYMDWASKVKIENGVFNNNTVTGYGGAVTVYDRYMEAVDQNGGSQKGKEAKAYNMNYDQWKKVGLAANLTIDGGDFSENTAYVGGAFYISSDNVNINKATINNNTARIFGGGIYVSSVPYVLNIKNAYIHDNHAIANDGYRLVTYKNDNGKSINKDLFPASGGGVWYCPTGDSEVYISNGVAFKSNDALREGDDFASVEKKDGTYKITVLDRMLGGGKVDWYNDVNGNRYKKGDESIGTIVDKSEAVNLKASGKDSAYEMAEHFATVEMTGNKAARGGAIATNGTVVFGEKGKDFNLTVNKKWSEALKDSKKDITVNLIVKDGEDEYVVDTVVLNEKNNWMHTFEMLPLEAGNKKINYILKEAEEKEYVVSYDDNSIIDTENVNEGDSISYSITNDKKPEVPEKPEEPKVPEKPEEPKVPEKPEEPKVPKKPEEPQVPQKPEEPQIPETPKVQEEVKNPHTGDEMNLNSYLMFVVISGILFTLVSKKYIGKE